MLVSRKDKRIILFLFFYLGLEFSVFVFWGQKFWVCVLCLMLWWCGGLIFRICSCIILCWCGSNANFLDFKFSGFVFLFKCLMCSCLISCSCLIWCGFDFSRFVWFFFEFVLLCVVDGVCMIFWVCACVFLFKISRSKFMYFIIFNSVFSFFI